MPNGRISLEVVVVESPGVFMEKVVKQTMTAKESQQPEKLTMPVQEKEYLPLPVFVTYARPGSLLGSKLLNILNSIPLPSKIKSFFRGSY